MSALTHPVLADKSVTIGAASASLIGANAVRNFLWIENTHATQTVWMNLAGGTAAANAAGCILLAAGGGPNSRAVFDTSVPANAITGIGSGAGTTVTILEG